MAPPTFYFPGRRFPSVSVTGGRCMLACLHCNGRYLRGMRSCTEPGSLVALAQRLEEEGALGMLLSGGCGPDGRVPLDGFHDAIREIKETTGLLVNLHVGPTGAKDARRVAESGADAVSVEVVGDDRTIEKVYGLRVRKGDHQDALMALADSGSNVVPHITVGLGFGKLSGEERALDIVERLSPKVLVLNALMPTKDTHMESVEPDPADLLRVLEKARKRLPDAVINVGCMRPRDHAVDQRALELGADGIVLPAARLVRGLRHEKKELCCAFS